MLERLHRARQVLARRGLGYGLYLLRGVLAPRLARRALSAATPKRCFAIAAAGAALSALLVGLFWGAVTAAVVFLLALLALATVRPLWSTIRTHRLLQKARSRPATDPPEQIPTWESWPVPEATRRAVQEKQQELGKGGELVLGRIERDGLLATDLGTFPGFEPVPLASFHPRDRFDLDLVLLEGRPALRKDFRGDRSTFAREWAALSRLAGKARVPAVLRVDEGGCRLYRSLVPGRPLNDMLVAAGARIREAQLEGDAELAGLRTLERLETVLARGRKVLPQAVEEKLYQELEQEMDRIHSHGVTGLSLTFGNLTVAKDGRPWLFDFDGARLHATTEGSFFALHRDRDRQKYNRIYGRRALTEARAREILRPLDGDYSPLDLGRGLTTRGFWSVDSGTGRWEFLNGEALAGLLPGARVLDLGSHTGIMPLLMLRDGARQVVGVEHSVDRAENALRLRQVFEWRYSRPFDLQMQTGDMRMILEQDFGTFDLVTAYCSLYYLEEADMARIVARAAELAPVLVLQAKTDTRREAGDKARKSQVDFLRHLLEENGFPEVELITKPGYSRPLLIGRRPQPAPQTAPQTTP